jgi:serine/threonine protein kinase
MPFVAGENVGPYRIIEQLGQGGMATVYKAYHPSLDRFVAIKALHPAFMEDPSFLARFQREARLVAKLEHPNIVPIYDAADHEGRPYLVMKFIQGETLKALLNRGNLTNTEKVKIIEAIGLALAYAHKQGVLHRDIKPSNVIIAQDGQVYLADFGLARIASAGESTLSSDMFIGTPQYISPEQAQGKRDLDEGTDIYSFGVLIYEMMVGKVPFSADTPYAIIHDHIFSPLPMPRSINPGLSEAMELVLLKALAKNRPDRYPDVSSLVAAFLQSFPTSTGIVGDKEPPTKSKTVRTPVEFVSPIHHGEDETEVQPRSAPPDQAVDAGVSPEPVVLDQTKLVNIKPGKIRKRWIVVGGVILIMCLCWTVLKGIDNRNKNLAKAELQAGDAVALAQKQVEEAPSDPRAHLSLAEAYFDSGKRNEAEKEYRAAMEFAGDDFGFYAEVGAMLMSRQAWLPASEVFYQLAEKHPKPLPADLLLQMHEAWYKGSELKEFPISVPFDGLFAIDPLMAATTKARHELYNGGPVRARITLAPILERNPDYQEAKLVQVELLVKSGNPEEAKKVLESLRSETENPAWIQAEIKRLSETFKP